MAEKPHDKDAEQTIPLWGAVLKIGLPDGVVRHPRMIGVLEGQLGRAVLTDLSWSGVRVSYDLEGETYTEAEADSVVFAAEVLGILGLPESAILRHTILSTEEVDEALGGGQPTLTPVQD